MSETPGNHITIVCAGAPAPRLHYTLLTLFEERMGLQMNLVHEDNAIPDPSVPCIAYGKPAGKPIPYIPASGFLCQSGVDHAQPKVVCTEEYPVLFPVADTEAMLQFDLPSALFWLLSRYEEYQPFTPDSHGRFHAKASLLHQHNLLETPLAEMWLEICIKKLRKLFPNLIITPPNYQFIPTFDIDSPWAYRHKPFVVKAGGVIRTLLRADLKQTSERLRVLAKQQKDPFDTFDTIEKIHLHKEKPLLFFLLGEYNQHNKNPNPGNKAYRKLINALNQTGRAGIHPSYETLVNHQQLQLDVNTLAEITGKPVIRSRQHFLRFRLPETYQALIAAGITDDYSMAFADHPGFRAGTSLPFRFYNLKTEEETNLTIWPTTLMDGTLRDYMNCSVDDAMEKITTLAQTVRKYNGTFISLWHNESLDGSPRWKGWTAVYKHLVACCSVSPESTDPNTIM